MTETVAKLKSWLESLEPDALTRIAILAAALAAEAVAAGIPLATLVEQLVQLRADAADVWAARLAADSAPREGREGSS